MRQRLSQAITLGTLVVRIAELGERISLSYALRYGNRERSKIK
jgi:hypothetical protein